MAPKSKRGGAAEVEVPSRDQNPAERSRLLNVLAQRRYRSRRRARLQALEALASDAQRSTQGGSNVQSASEHGPVRVESAADVDQSYTASIHRDAGQEDDMDFGIDLDVTQQPGELDRLLFTSPVVSSSIDDSAGFSEPQDGLVSTSYIGALVSDNTLLNSTLFPNDISRNLIPAAATDPVLSFSPSYSAVLNCPATKVPSIAAQPFPSHHLPSPTTSMSNPIKEVHAMSIPGLTLLRAHCLIYQRITNSSNFDIWNFSSLSPFNLTTSRATTLDISHLPANYKPTLNQSQLPHHPLFDLLPWPSVRNTIIAMLALPEEVRPPRMQGGVNQIVLNFMGDIKDAEGGVRVCGTDPFNQENWEIGQVFLDGWWWALNEEIVTRSNALREARGAARLKLGRLG